MSQREQVLERVHEIGGALAGLRLLIADTRRTIPYMDLRNLSRELGNLGGDVAGWLGRWNAIYPALLERIIREEAKCE